MNVYAANKHQKLRWIKDGENIELLLKDNSKWIEIAARKRAIELKADKVIADNEIFKNSMDADLFDVIVLSEKSDQAIFKLIRDNKFLTYFAKHENLSFRVRAKVQLNNFSNYIWLDSIFR